MGSMCLEDGQITHRQNSVGPDIVNAPCLNWKGGKFQSNFLAFAYFPLEKNFYLKLQQMSTEKLVLSFPKHFIGIIQPIPSLLMHNLFMKCIN